MGRTAFSPFSAAMKLRALHEKTPARACAVGFVSRYSRAAKGRLELSGSPASNGLQPVISTFRGSSSSSSVTVPNGKRASKRARPNRGRPHVAPPDAVAGVLEAERLPARHRALDDARPVRVSLDAHRREHAGLVEDVRLVAQRDVGEGARPLEAEHPRPHPAERERDPLQGLALVGAVVRPPGRPLRGRPARSLLLRFQGADGPERAHGGDRPGEERPSPGRPGLLVLAGHLAPPSGGPRPREDADLEAQRPSRAPPSPRRRRRRPRPRGSTGSGPSACRARCRGRRP